jgi:environmental stress-induced protein Ves
MTRASWLALPPEPWKNGGGVTRTLAADPAGRWRVSIADIDRNGPYSRFPGFDRVSVVLSGKGVTLQGGGKAVPLRPHVAAVFDGDALLQSTLVGGPVRVLNLFVLRGEAMARVMCAGSTAGYREVGELADAAARRAVTRVVVALDAGRVGGPSDVQVALGAGEYLLARGAEMPGVAMPGVDTPEVASPLAWTPTTENGIAVILDIAVHDGDPT